jgi:hypothetical protein
MPVTGLNSPSRPEAQASGRTCRIPGWALLLSRSYLRRDAPLHADTGIRGGNPCQLQARRLRFRRVLFNGFVHASYVASQRARLTVAAFTPKV